MATNRRTEDPPRRRGPDLDIPLLWIAGALASACLAACGSQGGGPTGPAVPPGPVDPPPAASGVDLVPMQVEFTPQSVSAGQTIQVSDTVANTGVEFAPTFSVAIYLSEDDQITASDLLLGFRSLAGLAAESESTGGGSVTIPTFVAEGTWYVGTVADQFLEVTEEDEANNALTSLTTLEVVPTLLPNATAETVSFQPLTVEAGQAIDVTDSVRNTGQSAAGSFVVGIYLSADTTITTTDTLIGLRAVPSLAVGAQSQATGAITIPPSVVPGSWYVGTVADTQGELAEADEFDNHAVSPIPIEITAPPLPDLSVSQLSFSPFQVDIGAPILVTQVVTNTGLGPAGTFETGVYLSTDALISTDDRLLSTETLSSLAVGESASSSLSIVIPADTPGGAYHVGAICDHTSLLPELAEANNFLTSPALLTVIVPPLPDLDVVSVSFGPTLVNAGVGDVVTVTDTVQNAGVLPSGPFRVGYYLSSNTAISSSDFLIGTRDVFDLAPGASSTATVDLPVPTTTPGGSWYVGVLADDLDVVLEPSTGNNALFAAGALDVVSSPDPLPDLEMEELTLTATSVTPGSVLGLQDQVRNVGDLSAGAFHVGVYLSLDDEITTDDTLLVERIVFGLSIDFGSASSFQATLPSTLPAGSYRVGAIADHHGVIDEHDEDNNVLVLSGALEVFVPPPPMPDLRITSFDLTPLSAGPGETLTVQDTVENGGDLSTSSLFRVGYYLSSDGEVTTDDLLLGSRFVSGLPEGQSSSGTQQFALPAGLAAGSYTVGAIVDDLSAVEESDEENNQVDQDEALEVQG